MKNLTLVHSAATAKTNIVRFNEELKSQKFAQLVRLLPHVQAWYATRQSNGKILFAPSKFIGYSNMSAELYIAETGANGSLDGRVTEKKLSSWARVVDANFPESDALHQALAEFCGQYGATPNARARISLFQNDGEEQIGAETTVLKAITLLISTLSVESKRTLRKLV
jgi:hypothetical protein